MRWFFSGKQYLKLIDISSPIIFKNLYIKFLFNLFLLPTNYSMNNLKNFKKICIKNNLILNYFTNTNFLSTFGSSFFIASSNNFKSFIPFFETKVLDYLPFLFFFKNYNIQLNFLKNLTNKFEDKKFLYKFLFILNITCNFSYFFFKTIINIVLVFVRLIFLLVNLSTFMSKKI